ncbi:MAG: hypothetical protein WCJ09_16105 [Planctomycetota bacterium]
MGWFPPFVDERVIPALRRLGQGGITEIGSRDHEGLYFRSYHWNDLELSRRPEIKAIHPDVVLALAMALNDGPKQFEMPSVLVPLLNKVEIPLAVRDYAQPFPTCIVKNNSEYHIVRADETGVHCLVCIGGIKVDTCGMFQVDRTIESYLSETTMYSHVPIDDRREAIYPVEAVDHRFRATLNFLLMVMAGGFTIQKPTQHDKQQKKTSCVKYTVPDRFEPQDLPLWRVKLANATSGPNATGEPTGIKYRPHWRRAHWRRVAVGVGRVGRELRLIHACLVNRDRLPESADVAESSYSVAITTKPCGG